MLLIRWRSLPPQLWAPQRCSSGAVRTDVARGLRACVLSGASLACGGFGVGWRDCGPGFLDSVAVANSHTASYSPNLNDNPLVFWHGSTPFHARTSPTTDLSHVHDPNRTLTHAEHASEHASHTAQTHCITTTLTTAHCALSCACCAHGSFQYDHTAQSVRSRARMVAQQAPCARDSSEL